MNFGQGDYEECNVVSIVVPDPSQFRGERYVKLAHCSLKDSPFYSAKQKENFDKMVKFAVYCSNYKEGSQ